MSPNQASEYTLPYTHTFHVINKKSEMEGLCSNGYLNKEPLSERSLGFKAGSWFKKWCCPNQISWQVLKQSSSVLTVVKRGSAHSS